MRKHVKPHRRVAGHRSITTVLREAVYFRLQHLHGRVNCFVCGNPVEKRHATLEHIIPRAHGGGNNWSNLAISHSKCNCRKGSMIPAARARLENT